MVASDCVREYIARLARGLGNRMKKKRKQRSAVKSHDRGLRNPGESAEEYFEQEGVHWFYFSTGCGFMALLVSGLSWICSLKPLPWLSTENFVHLVVPPLGVVLIAIGCRDFKKHLSYLIGAEGERSVGRTLDELKGHGWCVLHDALPEKESKANIDHVLIGPTGVYAVETKHWQKERGKDVQIAWDRKQLHFQFRDGGRTPCKFGPDTVRQAESSAQRLSEALKRETGREWPVRGALLFPGWYVRREGPDATSGLMVGNPKYLCTRLKDWQSYVSSPKLSADDIALARARVEAMCVRG